MNPEEYIGFMRNYTNLPDNLIEALLNAYIDISQVNRMISQQCIQQTNK